MPVYAKDHEVYDEIQSLKADVAKLKKAAGIDQEEPKPEEEKPAADETPVDVTETTEATTDTSSSNSADESDADSGEGDDDDDALTPRKRGRPRKSL